MVSWLNGHVRDSFTNRTTFLHSQVIGYLFNDYWEDIGTIKSFFEANLALAHQVQSACCVIVFILSKLLISRRYFVFEQPPLFEFYDATRPIYTSPRFLPPAKIVGSKLTDAIVSHGAYLDECIVENAIIGLRSRIGKGVVIRVSALLPRPAINLKFAVIVIVIVTRTFMRIDLHVSSAQLPVISLSTHLPA